MSDNPKLLSVADRKASGRARRARMPRGAHAEWTAPVGRRDPVATLVENGANRIAALLPLRYGRMSVDAFTFLRGAASIMAADLGSCPDSGIRAQLCGDAHIGNFGAFAGGDGVALYDVNDFDETLPGPFEWDVKRLAASLVVCGRVQGLADKALRALARRAVQAYRCEIAQLSGVAPFDAWRSRIVLDHAIDAIGDRALRKRIRRRMDAAVTSCQDGYSHLVSPDGGLRLPERPPAIFRLGAHERTAHDAFAAYLGSLREEVRVLMERYRLRDVAFKAVGVGSVGTFCAIGLFANAEGDKLLLQLKQATASVLAPFVGLSVYPQHGERVVVGQRMLQAEPDLFLGWTRSGERDFYVRRLKDTRLAEIGARIEAGSLPFAARLAGRTLARAHARAGDDAVIAGYLGEGDSFDAAVAQWALAYAEQTSRDFTRFKAAISAGEIEATIETKS